MYIVKQIYYEQIKLKYIFVGRREELAGGGGGGEAGHHLVFKDILLALT